jgi:hypothetical protein
MTAQDTLRKELQMSEGKLRVLMDQTKDQKVLAVHNRSMSCGSF